MDRLDTLQLFVRIVELGSFTLAAQAQGIPRATATHAIKALETRLGARLLERTTRQVRPTLDGQAFHARCLRVLQELDDAESALRATAESPRGTLRLDLHGVHATHVILPRIGEFHARHPRIELIISCCDRLVDLVGEGIDCVVRAGQPRDSTLVARRLANMPEILCASPDYLARHGTPQHPDELPAHQAVGFFSRGNASRYPFTVWMDGDIASFEAKGWMRVSDAHSYAEAALAGCGLIQVPRFRVAPFLEDGRLVQVLPQWQCPDLPVSAMYPFHRQLAPRLRVFVDWLAEIYVARFGLPQASD
ncbi:Transcriptional regulator [plant metagenome]|uniref:Transcriptional regulator n=1 Tax=plant metagenome TaxID=1297885 RepID=A0A484U080_9ZZZZ